MTALLFTIGKLAIGAYIGRTEVASQFGAAASLAVLLLWIYYAAQVFLMGDEFTRVYAHMHGSRSGEPIPQPVAEAARESATGTRSAAARRARQQAAGALRGTKGTP